MSIRLVVVAQPGWPVSGANDFIFPGSTPHSLFLPYLGIFVANPARGTGSTAVAGAPSQSGHLASVSAPCMRLLLLSFACNDAPQRALSTGWS